MFFLTENWIVMEYLHLRDLKTFLMVREILLTTEITTHSYAYLTQDNPRPVKKLIKYMLDVAKGMLFISEIGLVHRVSSSHVKRTGERVGLKHD